MARSMATSGCTPTATRVLESLEKRFGVALLRQLRRSQLEGELA